MAALEGSKSIKIRQCNENLALVDEWPLFRGTVIEEFHCIIFHLIRKCEQTQGIQTDNNAPQVGYLAVRIPWVCPSTPPWGSDGDLLTSPSHVT